MERAAQLAALSPRVDPNPRVGCVVVDADGVILAEGYHRGAGTWHAEAAAINEAIATGVDLRGATAYVTLEPCSHTGRTPSCARALIRAGVARVVFGQPDPNGAAAGGAQILREAGVAVEQVDTLAAASRDLNADWTFSVTHARPFVRWKYASTLDGFSAASDGTSQWITGPAARVDVHAQRAEHGAIVVGTGTVLADDPQLTVRDTDGTNLPTQPLRVVIGDRDLPADARVVDDAAVERARSVAPETTRAALRGRFITAAREAGRDFTVDWVHLKLSDGSVPTVALTDPFAEVDPRVDDLIAALGR